MGFPFHCGRRIGTVIQHTLHNISLHTRHRNNCVDIVVTVCGVYEIGLREMEGIGGSLYLRARSQSSASTARVHAARETQLRPDSKCAQPRPCWRISRMFAVVMMMTRRRCVVFVCAKPWTPLCDVGIHYPITNATTIEELALLIHGNHPPAVLRLAQTARNTITYHTFLTISSFPALAPLPMLEGLHDLHILFCKA